MNRDDVIRLAKDAGLGDHQDFRGDSPVFAKYLTKLEGFATLVIAEFLKQTEQYVTNDASRKAVISEAVAAETEACAKVAASYRMIGSGMIADAIRDRAKL